MPFHFYKKQWLLLGLSLKESLTYNVLNANLMKGLDHSSQNSLAYQYDDTGSPKDDGRQKVPQSWII